MKPTKNLEKPSKLSLVLISVVGLCAVAAAPEPVDLGEQINEDTQKGIELAAIDPGNCSMTTCQPPTMYEAEIQIQPMHGVLVKQSARSYQYTPNANFHGTDSFTYSVKTPGCGTMDTSCNSAANSKFATVTITVNPVADAPEAVAQDLVMDEDDVLEITLEGTDGDAEDLTQLSYEVITNPTKGSLNTSMGKTLFYTPESNFVGIDRIEYRVKDPSGLTSERAVISIAIRSVNDLPLAMNQTVSVDEDDQTNITLMASDVDMGAMLDYVIVDQPMFGALSGTGANLIYTPTENFSGDDFFTFKAVDDEGGESNIAKVSIVVGASNDQPVFTAASPATGDVIKKPEGQRITFKVDAIDADEDELIYSIKGLDDLEGATFDSSTGEFEWLPNWRHVGMYPVTLGVTDSVTEQVTVDVTIEVVGLDTDGDLIPDTLEVELGTDPMLADSDMDTISDRDEIDFAGKMAIDTDGDGTIDARATDSDGDGLRDADEAGDGDIGTAPFDSDGDGFPDYRDTDSDNDTVGDKDDNCRFTANMDQLNLDGDESGDVCDTDRDGDGIENSFDFCPDENGMGTANGCIYVPPEPEPEPEGLCQNSTVHSAPAGSLGLLAMICGLAFGLVRRRRR